MKTTESADSKKKVGGSIDSWCGKCKMVLAHTIEAMVGEKPARVTCNTCKSQHTYKAQAPGTGTRRSAATPKTGATPRTGRVGGNKYQSLLRANETVAVKVYSPMAK